MMSWSYPFRLVTITGLNSLNLMLIDSFSEIFIHKEYLDLLPKDTPLKIIDLGSHYGYFSLWLQSMYPKSKIRSLLVEPSSKCHKSLSMLTEHEKIKGRFVHLAKGVGNPKGRKLLNCLKDRSCRPQKNKTRMVRSPERFPLFR